MNNGKARLVMEINTLKMMLGIPEAIEISMVSQTPDQHISDVVELHLRGPGLYAIPPATIPAIVFADPPRDRPLACDVFLCDFLRDKFPEIPANDLSQFNQEVRTRPITLDAPDGN